MMMFDNQLDYRKIEDRWWYTIKEDKAFDSILEGWDNFSKVYLEKVKNRNVVIQAGGYCGIFPKLFSEIFQLVYTFEPTPLNFYCLNKNCQSSNVVKLQAALGNEHKNINVDVVNSQNRGMNRVNTFNKGYIPMLRIDDLCLDDCDLIQLDCEGFEFEILKGAKNTIEKFYPVIAVEDTNPSIENLLFELKYEKVNSYGRDTVYAK